MEGEDQMLNNGSGETEQNSADFFVNSESNQPLPEVTASKTTIKEKINTVLIVLVAIVAVFLGYYQLSYNVSHPFSYAETNTALDATANCPNGNCDLQAQLATIITQQNKDTDADGLTDAQEINIYRSSPFLEDSDSDGLTDGFEVEQGSDPNCPQGQNCFTGGSAAVTGTVPAFTLVPDDPHVQITPAMIRDALRQSGFSDEYLNQFSDADMISLYQEVLSSEPSMAETASSIGLDLDNLPSSAAAGTVNISTSSLSSSTVNLNIKSVDDLKNLTGAQIRQLMIQSGAPESVLSQVSDDELKKIFLEKLSENQNVSNP